MTPENFAYWVQGMFEGKTSLTPEQQIQTIKDHLKLVMTKVTPDYTITGTEPQGIAKDSVECSKRNTIDKVLEEIEFPRQRFPPGAIC